MKTRTYYDVLGVSRNATAEEITNAKNALAKIYHPDANIQNGTDTTALMQEILEAYSVLSNPKKRKKYNQKVFGERERVFRTFTVGPETKESSAEASFVECWNAATKLYETVEDSTRLLAERGKKKSLLQWFLGLFGKTKREKAAIDEKLSSLSRQAVGHITVLKLADIPHEYWRPEAMNWMLICWGQRRNMDSQGLIARYNAYIKANMDEVETENLIRKNEKYREDLKILLSYAVKQ